MLWRGGQGTVQGPGTGTDNNQSDRDAEHEQVIFESLALLVTVPVDEEPVLPVNCDDRYEHHTRDAEGGDACQEPDRKAERTQELSSNRQEREYRRNPRAREKLHGPPETMTAKPAEHFLSPMREYHNRQSESEHQSSYVTVRL